ncbi:hypothetical protein [Amycolatopsis sp. NPDC021455]|uniref:hypothetical protein n=1 Tax=Amycolatopsis sp. NPDC021455 TaxID=3154901 RepID=UPI0033F75FB6
MADIVFTPTFRHTAWVDGTDPVEAADHPERTDDRGGFNSRFTAIENDLKQLSTVVAQVGAAIDARQASPLRQLVLPPALVPTDRLTPWAITESGAAQAAPGGSADGVLLVVPPDGVRLVSFRAVGQAAGVSIAVSLVRVALGTSPPPPQVLASVTGDANPFDKVKPIDPTLALVDPKTFRYVIKAGVPTTPAGNVTATLAAFQIIYATG